MGEISSISFDYGANGGNGGIASSSASGANAGNRALLVSSTAVGGNGGQGTITGNQGGNGGAASASASGISSGGGAVIASTTQTGGNGGNGGYPTSSNPSANGGNGADSVLNNASSGLTSGNLSLSQIAVAGTAGDSVTGLAGLAGKAVSFLDESYTGNSSLTTYSSATGGAGGSSTAELGSSDGGSATNNSHITSTSAQSIIVTGKAKGGNGGSNTAYIGGNGGGANSSSTAWAYGGSSVMVVDNAIGGNGGNGGRANSSAVAYNYGSQSVSATSTATGGNGGINGLGGSAISYAGSTSSSGNASSSATANGAGLPSLISAHANSFGGSGSQATAAANASMVKISSQASVDPTSSGSSDAIAAIGQTISSPQNVESAAYGTALPQNADAKTFLAGQTQINQNFNLSGNSLVWMLGEMAVSNTSYNTGLHDYQSSLNLSIDTASISTPQDILIGLLNLQQGYNSMLQGDTLSFSYQITGIGGTISKDYTFDSNNISTALNFFNNNTLDAGALNGFVNADNSVLNLIFNLDLKSSTSNTGFNFGLIVGNSTLGSGLTTATPIPAGFWLFGSAIACFIGFNRFYKLSD
jgi:hypothetical protein